MPDALPHYTEGLRNNKPVKKTLLPWLLVLVRMTNLAGFSCVYTRVLTRVQLTSDPEPSTDPPMDVG